MRGFIKGVGAFLYMMLEQLLVLLAFICALYTGIAFKSWIVAIITFVVSGFVFVGLAHLIKNKLGKNDLD